MISDIGMAGKFSLTQFLSLRSCRYFPIQDPLSRESNGRVFVNYSVCFYWVETDYAGLGEQQLDDESDQADQISREGAFDWRGDDMAGGGIKPEQWSAEALVASQDVGLSQGVGISQAEPRADQGGTIWYS